jgi:5-formyltetrahydrofolate cyclo-ligase
LKRKKEIRNFIEEQRKILKRDVKEAFDEQIFNKLIKSDEYKKAKTIFLYASFEGEVDTHRIIKHALADGKQICVPKILSKKEGMKAVIIESFNELKPSAYNILEPESFNKTIDEKNIDLILMPGVAFDNKGGRVGYGGAFYDRFLTKMKSDTLKIALAYDFQLLEEVPMDKHDKRIDGIITN